MVRPRGRRPIEQPRLIEVELIDDDLPPAPPPPWLATITIPPRWRRTAIAAVVVAVLAATGIGVWTHEERLDAQRLAALPYPLSTLAFHYDGISSVPSHAGTQATFNVRFTIRAVIPGNVDVTAIDQDYRGIATSIAPALPVRIEPGKSIQVTMLWRVEDCRLVPNGSFLPGVNVTGRNAKATQTWTVLFGGQYAVDLTNELGDACHGATQ